MLDQLETLHQLVCGLRRQDEALAKMLLKAGFTALSDEVHDHALGKGMVIRELEDAQQEREE